jgi:hypothetical protein
MSPYASVECLIKFMGMAIEEKFEKKGFTDILANDVDLVAAFDDILPSAIHSLAAPFQIALSFTRALIEHADVVRKAYQTQAGTVPPTKAPEETQKRSMGNTTTSQGPPPKKTKLNTGQAATPAPVASYPSPVEGFGSGEVSNRENNMER